MKAIVGLGNPGPQYRGTRHNVGFEVVDLLARRASVGFESAPAEALIAKWRRPDDGVLLVKPLTFMNLSGQAVGELRGISRSTSPTCSSSSTRSTCRSASCGRASGDRRAGTTG